MGSRVSVGEETVVEFSASEVTGAVGDAVTVLPVVVAVAVLTDLSLAVMLGWFGVFQVVWGLYYGVPVSVEPMKALAALVLAGALTAGELLVAGVVLGVVLLAAGLTRSLERARSYLGPPVVRGIQLGVALVLLETGLRLGGGDLRLAALAALAATVPIALGRFNLSAFVVIVLGGAIAAATAGVPTPALPAADGILVLESAALSVAALEGAVAQLGMTLGNAALAAAVLMTDYFDSDASADDLATSMGAMNLVSVPLGAFPMCHGSGGIAGKYAFGARTAGANVVLGVGYVAVALLGAGVVAAFPVAMLGVVLALVAFQLARTSLAAAEDYPLVVGVGVLGLAANLGVALVAGVFAFLLGRRVGRSAG